MSRQSATSGIVLVGPSHPYTGGIAQHTTRLALELEQRGHDVVVESWKAQYPRFLRPGQSTVTDNVPEIGIPTRLVAKLDWRSPLSWLMAGVRSRKASEVALSIPTPYHLLPYAVFLFSLGRGPKRLAIVHNITPHEGGPLDRFLMQKLLRLFDAVITHGVDEARLAEEMTDGKANVVNLGLPSPWTGKEIKRSSAPSQVTFLFFGTVRHYKGLDIFLEALTEVKNCKLLICGEFWEDEKKYQDLIKKLDLSDRVEVQSGYVAASSFPEVFGSADVLVLPYRTATGSFMTDLGFRHGLPVIASDAGSISSGIDNGVNGLIFEAGNRAALVEALGLASSAKRVATWRRHLQSERDRQIMLWDNYCDVFNSNSG